jgi:RES domain-containing protein
MILYRFTHPEFTHDLSGEGARRFGGRWNNRGNSVVYTSLSISLALLELLIHHASYDEITSNQLIIIETQNDQHKELSVARLKGDWYNDEEYSKSIGDDFLTSNSSLIFKVPSVIVPGEFNVLINPNHRDSNKVKIMEVRTFRFDVRLFKGVKNI